MTTETIRDTSLKVGDRGFVPVRSRTGTRQVLGTIIAVAGQYVTLLIPHGLGVRKVIVKAQDVEKVFA